MDKDGFQQSSPPEAADRLPVSETFENDPSERLRLVLEAASVVGTWVWNIPNDRVTADERFSRSFGIPAQRCEAGIPIAEAFHIDLSRRS